MEEQNQIEVIPAKRKRGRPVGWRGTYKKRVKVTEEVKEKI